MASPMWLLLLAACGDSVARATAGGSSTSSADDSTGVSAGQTSAPGPTSGEPDTTAESSSGTPTSSTTSTSSTTDATTDLDTTTGAPVDCTEVVLGDPGLRAHVLRELELDAGPVPLELALAREFLNLDPYPKSPEIDGLGGLECFANLRRLDISVPGAISDLGPLAGLSKLEAITLDGHAVSDLTPLAGLPALRVLILPNNQLADLAPLATLTTLTTLRLPGNQITSIEPLADLLALTYIDLDDNQIADLAALTGHPELQTLDLHGNAVTSVAPLVDLPALRSLFIGANQITDPSPLAGLVDLTSLELADNPLSGELSSLLALEQLTYLDLARTGATTLFAFAPAELHALFADGNAIIDLSPLAAHTKLESIGLADNQITTVAPIADAPFWQHNCVIADLDGNPLDAESLGTILPALCEAFDSISWDGGDCFACQGMP